MRLLALLLAFVPLFAGAQSYMLDRGDQIRVIVYGEEELSGEFTVGDDGDVAIPLIGSVSSVGRTAAELGNAIETKLSEGYLLEPKVSVELLNSRPFFILGEVNMPGGYPYQPGMTVLNAVALAQGFGPLANQKKMYLKRGENADEEKVQPNTPIQPGDVIRVPRKLF